MSIERIRDFVQQSEGNPDGWMADALAQVITLGDLRLLLKCYDVVREQGMPDDIEQFGAMIRARAQR